MSTLSKVFAVLLVVFSVAFTSMTVSIVARTANWKETAQRYAEHARVVDTNLRQMIAASSAELAAAHDRVQANRAQISQLEQKVQSQAADVADLHAQIAKLTSEKGSADAMNRGLLAQLQSAEAARSQYQAQRDGLERKNVDLDRRSIDLNDRVNELTAAVTVLQEEKRQYEQQLHILQQENDKLSNAMQRPGRGDQFESPSGLALKGVEAATPVSGTPIRGRVTEVKGDLVTISVGRADGVMKGMKFVIHRGDDYVGDLVIDAVDPNQSAGRLTIAPRTPSLGDIVTDARQLGNR